MREGLRRGAGFPGNPEERRGLQGRGDMNRAHVRYSLRPRRGDGGATAAADLDGDLGRGGAPGLPMRRSAFSLVALALARHAPGPYRLPPVNVVAAIRPAFFFPERIGASGYPVGVDLVMVLVSLVATCRTHFKAIGSRHGQ